MRTKIELELSNGETRIYEGEQVVTANIFECNNPILTDLPIGTLDVTIYSPTDEFNFLNERGIGQYIKQGNTIKIYYAKDYDNPNYVQLGLYYVEEFETKENNQISIHATDILGLLDKHIYNEDLTWDYDAQAYWRPLQDVFNSSGKEIVLHYGQYSYEGEFWDFTNGYPVIDTSRNVLLRYLVAFVYDMIVNRDGSVFIFNNNTGTTGRRPKTNEYILTNKKVFQKSQNTQIKQIKSTEAVSSTNQKLNEVEEIYNYTFKTSEGWTGTFDIKANFEDNHYDYTIQNATIVESSRGSITFRVNMAGSGSSGVNVIISAKKIEILEKARRTKNYVITEEQGEIIRYENGVASKMGSGIVTVYNNSFIAEMQILMNDDLNEKAGYKTTVELSKDLFCDGIITEMDIDVTGGLIADIKVLCDRRTLRETSVNLLAENEDYLMTENNNYIMTEGE